MRELGADRREPPTLPAGPGGRHLPRRTQQHPGARGLRRCTPSAPAPSSHGDHTWLRHGLRRSSTTPSARPTTPITLPSEVTLRADRRQSGSTTVVSASDRHPLARNAPRSLSVFTRRCHAKRQFQRRRLQGVLVAGLHLSVNHAERPATAGGSSHGRKLVWRQSG